MFILGQRKKSGQARHEPLAQKIFREYRHRLHKRDTPKSFFPGQELSHTQSAGETFFQPQKGHASHKGWHMSVEEAIEFLFILGFYYGALQVTTSLLYTYKGVEIVLVKVPKFGYYFEAEALVEKRFVTSANKKISLVCQELGLNILSDKDFWKLLQNLNNRPGFRFNFKKQKFSDIKKRFKEYF